MFSPGFLEFHNFKGHISPIFVRLYVFIPFIGLDKQNKQKRKKLFIIEVIVYWTVLIDISYCYLTFYTISCKRYFVLRGLKVLILKGELLKTKIGLV